jgi:hypothetical protein
MPSSANSCRSRNIQGSRCNGRFIPGPTGCQMETARGPSRCLAAGPHRVAGGHYPAVRRKYRILRSDGRTRSKNPDQSRLCNECTAMMSKDDNRLARSHGLASVRRADMTCVLTALSARNWRFQPFNCPIVTSWFSIMCDDADIVQLKRQLRLLRFRPHRFHAAIELRSELWLTMKYH